MPFPIDISPAARDHLKLFRKRDQQIILDAIANQLENEPARPTRHRKKLDDNDLAPWELRVGDFRVFYDIDLEEQIVVIVAIGKKTHNILHIGGEEIDL